MNAGRILTDAARHPHLARLRHDIQPLPIRSRLLGGLAATGLGGKPATASRELDIELLRQRKISYKALMIVLAQGLQKPYKMRIYKYMLRCNIRAKPYATVESDSKNKMNVETPSSGQPARS